MPLHIHTDAPAALPPSGQAPSARARNSRPRKALTLLALSLLTLPLAAPQAQAATLYTAVLATPLVNSAYGTDINESGLITGTHFIGSLAQAFVGDATEIRGFGTYGNSYGMAINNQGQVAGYEYRPGSSGAEAFVGTIGNLSFPPSLVGGDSIATGINDAGQIVGYTPSRLDVWEHCNWGCHLHSDPVDTHAFLGGASGMHDLGTLGGSYSHAYDLTYGGNIVGASYTSGDTQYHAFIGGTGGLIDLGTLGGGYSVAQAINHSSQVAGYSTTANGQGHAFVTQGNGFLPGENTLIDLGILAGGFSSYAHDLNDQGNVVGYASTASGLQSAFLWTATEGMRDLNMLAELAEGWRLFDARGINNAGQIVANGRNAVTGQTGAFILSLNPNYSPVPLPAGLPLLGSGILALVALRRRRR